MPYLPRASFYLRNKEAGRKIPKKRMFVEKRVRQRRLPRGKFLLAHHDAESVAPAFREAHANDLQFRQQIFQELVGGGMKSQRGRNQVNEWRNLLQFDAGEIAVTSDFSAMQMTPNAQPVVGGLQGQVNVLAGFQFDDGQLSRTRDGEEIENSVFAAGIGEYLSVDEARIKRRIHSCDILANDGFQPAFGLSAVERMARVFGEWMAMVGRGPRSRLSRPSDRAQRQRAVSRGAPGSAVRRRISRAEL